MFMGFDFNELLNNINTGINNFIAKAQAYFKSLTQYEMFAWIGEAVGVILVVLALILW
jgi:hypothetical protein